MKQIYAVIGANFGDEGKGLLTDYLAARAHNGMVVRFNGGAQAGHTVTTRDNLRHVFSHIGAGSFAGLPTYLSRFYVANPLLFNREIALLQKLGVSPTVYIDEACFVTTPYDMMLNQIAEIVRGGLRHGSCGLGFNETITRSLHQADVASGYQISVRELYNQTSLHDKLKHIQEVYVPARLQALHIVSVPDEYKMLLTSDAVRHNYLEDVRAMLSRINVVDADVMQAFDTLIFEGAQGLLLDQIHAYFPHVTRSNTGMQNVAELLWETGLAKEKLEIVYVTRAYMTRHGAGPLPAELPVKPYHNIEDKTNIYNPYQGNLRFGLLDINSLGEAIHSDLRHAAGLAARMKLAVTCLDQVDGEAIYMEGACRRTTSVHNFVDHVFRVVGAHQGYAGYGPTREAVSLYE